MKLKVSHFDVDVFRKKLDNLKYIDFSLFIDSFPENQEELSSINILVLQEPNEYFGIHDLAIKHQDMFSFILTWDDKVLNNCKNAIFLPFGHTWFHSEQYEKNHDKKFELSHLCGNLLKSYGHQIRHELMARQNEFQIPLNFHQTIGDRHNIEDARLGKETVFGNSMFGVAIENFSHRGYFSEKILDCFLMKTIPVYWGCSNIGDFFNKKGLIEFGNPDDLIYIMNGIDEKYYISLQDIIEENYTLALQYVDYEQKIINQIIEIFKLNNLL
jgi:hypothetical protein